VHLLGSVRDGPPSRAATDIGTDMTFCCEDKISRVRHGQDNIRVASRAVP
jgi:hypothetical protein